jgi:hypothetical protein
VTNQIGGAAESLEFFFWIRWNGCAVFDLVCISEDDDTGDFGFKGGGELRDCVVEESCTLTMGERVLSVTVVIFAVGLY